MNTRLYLLLSFWLVLWLSLLLPSPAVVGQPQPQKPPPSFFGTYTYLAYAILDRESGPEPIAAQGVGGTLTLRPDGTYQKHLALTANGSPMHFDQDGRFTFTPSRISFSYTDKKGHPRTDEGTFQLSKSLLIIKVAQLPVGNQSIYTLRRQ